MLEVTVKTLDSQNHSFSVSDDSTVKEFKEQIAPVLKIAADKQRLIFCGRVLQDDKKLNEYDVNGKVIHLVQRPPPQANQTSSANSTSTTTGTTRAAHRDAAGFLLGAFTIPQDVIDATQVQNIVQDVVSGMGEIGRNATVMSRTSEDGSSVDVHINLGQVPLQSEAQLRMNRVQTMLIRANRLLESLEDGNNSNNAGSSDSPMQTDNEEAEVRNSSPDESRNSPNHTDSTSSDTSTSNGGPMLANLLNSFSAEPIVISAEAESTEQPTPAVDRFRFEGLAHAAHAAVTAAVAAAAAAARVATGSTSGIQTNVIDSSAPIVAPQGPEPMESSVPDTNPTETSAQAPKDAPKESVASQTIPTSGTVGSQMGSSVEPMEISDPIVTIAEGVITAERVVTAEGVTTADGVTTATQSDPSPEFGPINSSERSSAATNTTSTTTNARPNRRETQLASVQTLANLLDEVMRLNTRLQPHLQRCMELIRSDPPLAGNQTSNAQRMFSRISQLLHFLSHAYHSLSDLHINFAQAPPRSPRVRIISSTSSPPLFHGIPVQAQISISTTTSPVLPTNFATTTTASSLSTTNTTTNASSANAAEPRLAPRLVCHYPAGAPPRSETTTASNPPAQPILRSENPLVFMEVLPNSITIDSISAVDATITNSNSAARTATTTSTTNSNAAPREPTTQSSAESQPAPTRIPAPPTFNVSNITGQGNHPLRNLIPVPLTSMGSLHQFDCGLPCHSVWALEPSRRRHNAGNSRTTSTTSSTTTTNSSHNAGVTPNAQGRQEDQLQQVISNIMTSLLSPQTLHGPAVQATPGFAMFASANPADMPRGSRFFLDSTGLHAHETLHTVRPRPEPAATASSSNSTSRPSQSAALTDDVFPNLFQAIALQMTGSGQNQSTIAEVLTRLDSTFDIDEHNILGNLLMCIARQVNFQDLVATLFGNVEPINEIIETLQNFLRQQVLHSTDPQEHDINLAVEQILIQAEDILHIISMDPRVRTEIDYKATIISFLRRSFRQLFHAILHPPDAPSFGSYLYAMCKTAVSEFLALNIHCFTDGVSSLERIANERIDIMTSGLNPIFRQWMTMMTTREIRNIIPNINVPVETLREYIVNKRVRSSPESPPTARGAAKPNEASGTSGLQSSLLRQSKPPASAGDGRLNRNETDNDTKMTNLPKRNEDTAAARSFPARVLDNRCNSTSITVSNGEITEVVIGNETWSNTVPREWVPIIARDVTRQRRQAPQAPFSEAYLGGMPSKRRKIMTNGTSANLMGPGQNSLPDILLQSISNCNVQPVTSLDEVRSDASHDATLQTAFNDHIRHTVQERLQSDLDYLPDRFPNAERYFNVVNL